MLQYFSKINYGFSGGTFTALNIFKNVQITIPNTTPEQTRIDDERPDQFSNRIYQTPDHYWVLFLTNNIRNPLQEWSITDLENDPNTDTELQNTYPGLVYQFGNVSKYNPTFNTPTYIDGKYDPYSGTDINRDMERLKRGQLIIFEIGNGNYSLRALGAGQIPINSVSGQPHHRQSVIPVIDGVTGIKQISCGSFNSAVLTDNNNIYYWGGNPYPFSSGTSDMYGGNYFFKNLPGCSYINSKNSGVLAIKSDGGITCFGLCTTFISLYGGDTGYVKTSWTEGLTSGVALKENGNPTYYGFASTPSGISLFDADCNRTDCIGINTKSNYGVTGWGPNKNNLFIGFNQGITGITAVALGYNHFLALKDNGTIYGGGNTLDGQLDIPSGVYSKISAGRYHSAALTTEGKMVVWGKIATMYDNFSPPISLQKVTPSALPGTFSEINSGDEHIIAKETGTNKKYSGVIDSVDTDFKRIVVKSYVYPDVIPELLNGNTANTDPASISVSIRDHDSNGDVYESYIIQHQLLSVQRHLDSTTKIIQGGNELQPSVGNNWKDIYLAGYKDAENNEFVTIKKDAVEQKTYDQLQLNTISETNIQTIKNQLSVDLKTKSEIKINIK